MRGGTGTFARGREKHVGELHGAVADIIYGVWDDWGDCEMVIVLRRGDVMDLCLGCRLEGMSGRDVGASLEEPAGVIHGEG